MGLKPHVKRLLESLPLSDSDSTIPNVEELRRSQRTRIIPVEQRPPVWNVEDISVAAPGRDIPIRIYSPTSEDRLPLLLYCHGGGFCIGSLESHDVVCRRLVNELGFKVIAVDYRLAPENQYPAGVEDCYFIAKWCSDNAPDLGIDPLAIAVAGDSSGGTFATVVCIMARDRGLDVIQKQVLICPNTEFYQSNLPTKYGSYSECGSEYLTTEHGISQFWSWYVPIQEANHLYVSPIKTPDLSNLPPALIITAEYDPLRDEGEAYARRLIESGVPVRAIRYDGTIHGFLGMFPEEDDGKQAHASIKDFLTW